MSLPGRNPNQKSILTDRAHQVTGTIPAPLESTSLRVTFAKPPGPLRQVHGFSSSLSVFHHGTAAISTPPTAQEKKDELNRKLQFPQTIENRVASPSPGQGGEKPTTSGGGAAKVSKTPGRRLGFVDQLFPENKNKPKLISGSSTGILGHRLTKSEDNVSKASKSSGPAPATKKSRSKKLIRRNTNKSVTSTSTRRTKSKKLKKRKKSKIEENELEHELTKPAHLNDEYVQEINKITQILRAVTAFDESTSTENGAIAGSPSGRDNVNSFFTYPGTSGSNQARLSSSSRAPRRPLSGDELKQLLSSITRVVSLHQIPVDGSGAKAGGDQDSKPGSANGSTPIPGTSQSPKVATVLQVGSNETTTTTKTKKRKVKKKKAPIKYPTFIEGSLSEPTHRRAATATQRPHTTKAKSKVSLGGSTTTKKKGAKKSLGPPRPNSDGGSSRSSGEKDPVKNAAFLRKYFEESVRLANKKSSEDLLALGAEAAVVTPSPAAVSAVDEKSKSKSVKKKKSLTRR